jgi:hypothetical protein
MTEIRKRILDVRNERRDEMRRRMDAYDDEVYYPAIRTIQAECAAIGHKPGGYKTNGFGWNWTECQSCGARVEQWRDDNEPPSAVTQ